MPTPTNQQSATAYQPRRRGKRPMGAVNDGGGYLAEWRERVNRELESTSQANQATAVILERLKGQIDEHDGRLKRLETSPEGLRSTFGTYGGCVGQVVFACLSGLGVLISITALIITLIR